MPQDILITPTSGEPQILFRGSGALDTAIQLNVLSSYQSASRSGTALVFEGTEGQLFAITDNLSSGVIFAVGDVTGLPLVKVDASGDVTLAEYGRFVGVGTGVPRFHLDVRGTGNFSTAVVTNNATVNGNLGVSNSSPGAKAHINTLVSTNKGLIVQGAAAQSANLQEWQNSAGAVIASIDKDGDITAPTGTFNFVQLTSTLPRQSGLLFLDTGGFLNTSPNLIYNYSNLASPKLAFRASGTTTPDISLNILTTASGSTSGVQTLSFEGSAGQLFSITDVLNSGTIFGVNDISGLPILEADATGLVSLARFGTGIEAYRAINAREGVNTSLISSTGNVRLNSTLLTLSGTTSSFPAIKRNAAAINFRLADDSGDAEITAGTGRFSGAIYNVGPIYNTSSASSNVYAMYASQYGYAFMRFDNWKTITFNAGESTAYEHSISIAGWRLNTNSNGSAYLHTDAANIFAQRNSTNAQTLRLYGTYTDASNYRRLYLSSTTAGAFTLGVEGAGTGASGNTLNFSVTSGVNQLAILPDEIRASSSGGNNLIRVNQSAGNSAIAIGHNSSLVAQATIVGVGSTGDAFMSIIAIGTSNNVTGGASVCIGRESSVTGHESIGLGRGINLARSCTLGYSIGSGNYNDTTTIASIVTTDNTPTTLKCRWYGGTNNFIIPSGRALFFVAHICGIKSDGSAVASYIRRGCIKNIGGTTSLVGTIETIGTDYEDNAATDVAITADNTNDALQIDVTGITGETWRWQASVKSVEMIYGT